MKTICSSCNREIPDVDAIDIFLIVASDGSNYFLAPVHRGACQRRVMKSFVESGFATVQIGNNPADGQPGTFRFLDRDEFLDDVETKNDQKI